MDDSRYRAAAIDILQRMYDYASSEMRMSSRQADAARETQDFRAMDRHLSYAQAMQKIQGRVSVEARANFGHDVTRDGD